MFKDFFKFAMRGNALDMAVGVVIGAAFGTIVSSLVNDVLMPPLGLLLGGLDFSSLFLVLKEGTVPGPYATPVAAKAAGAVTLNYGLFANAAVSFFIIAFAVFWVVKGYNNAADRLIPKEDVAPTTKTCPECCTQIPVDARRCPACTSTLN
ncbi:MAG: large conductance mechanosensitive channel protein MscL [Rhodocyclaceae bacterium]|nr:large conductance mechanosensitive channel protein MscL [Rhodocyclaceae bacterium]